MEKMKDLRDLLKHEIKDLYSAEEQILMAMPGMIEKVQNPTLKQSLQRHLQITEEQLDRLEKVQQLMKQGDSDESEDEGGQDGGQEGGREGLFTRLLRKRTQGNEEAGSGGEKCRGMQGLIEEGEKIMAEEMEPSVMDAAIIACAQKIEHYEICGYGTARAFARELNLNQVAELLEQTLDEEYEADDRLTDLAVGRVNEEAEKGSNSRSRTRVTGNGNLTRGSGSSNEGRSGGRTASGSTTSRSKSGAKAAASNKRGGAAASGRGAASSSRGGASGVSDRGTGRTKGAAKSTGGRSSSPAPASKASNTRSTAKSGGRGASTSKSRSTSNAPSKAAAAKGGRNSNGGGRAGASKGTTSRGRGGSNGRSSGR